MKLTSITKICVASISMALIWTGSFGCKANRRGIPGGGEPATFKIKLTGPIETESTEKKNAWIYELSNCVATVQAAGIDEDHIVIFKSSGFKASLATPCQLRVKTLNIASFETSFKSPESGTFYWAREIPIRSNPKGEFYAEVSVEKLYSAIADSEKPTPKPVDKNDDKKKPAKSDVTVNATIGD